MLDIVRTRRRSVSTMGKTPKILGHILKGLTGEQAATLRDGEDGWTVLEVVCHLRDFDDFFHHRAIMMVEQDYPTLPAYDHEALARERQYNRQNLTQVYQALVESRERFIEFFKSLPDEAWERAGVHPERGHFTLTDAAIQVCTHDVEHIDQIVKILTQTG